MPKLTDYAADTRLNSSDILIKDGTGGTKKITAKNAAIELAGLISPINHRNVYRGKNLGTSVTAAQKAAIQNATFDDLFIGDNWVIDGVTWVIADMDYFYNTGDTAFTNHHLVIVPQSKLYDAQMNSESTADGGYIGSEMYTANLEQAKTKIIGAFGDMVLTHRELLINAVTDGHPSGFVWADSKVELMTEVMVYGTHHYAVMNSGLVAPSKHTIARQQLALFALYPHYAFRRSGYWLRDVVSGVSFARMLANGSCSYAGASEAYGVLPYFCIG